MCIFVIGIRINFADMLVIVSDFQLKYRYYFSRCIKYCMLLHLVSWLYVCIIVTKIVK